MDIAANRNAEKYGSKEILWRVAWGFGQWFIRLSPRPCFGFRCFILRSFGAKIGCHVHLYPSTRIYFPWNLEIGDWSALGEEAFIYNLGKVRLGSHVTISQRAHLCAGTHDYSKADMPLLKLPIIVEGQAWICADAFVGPGVTVGEGAVVGARAVVMKDVPAWDVMAGNPAVRIKKRNLQSSGSHEISATKPT